MVQVQHASISTCPAFPVTQQSWEGVVGVGEEGRRKKGEKRRRNRTNICQKRSEELWSLKQWRKEEMNNTMRERGGGGGWIPRDKEADLSSLKQPLVSAA